MLASGWRGSVGMDANCELNVQLTISDQLAMRICGMWHNPKYCEYSFPELAELVLAAGLDALKDGAV